MLYEVYTDKDSGGNVARYGFQKMIFDCYENRIDIVVVKTISRFARNTVDLLCPLALSTAFWICSHETEISGRKNPVFDIKDYEKRLFYSCFSTLDINATHSTCAEVVIQILGRRISALG